MMKSLIALKKKKIIILIFFFYECRCEEIKKKKKAQLDDPNGNQFWILRENRTPDFG